jgi:hypothetical protein
VGGKKKPAKTQPEVVKDKGKKKNKKGGKKG